MGCIVNIHNATEKYLNLSGKDLMCLKGPRSNVVARYKGKTGNPILHISAHIDTAAIQKEGWTVNPLGGQVTKDNPYGKSPYDRGGGFIWGRGANDDKGECVAMTYALEALNALGVKLKGDLILTGNCDEEIGGVAGLGYLIKEGIVKADYGIQLDGGLTNRPSSSRENSLHDPYFRKVLARSNPNIGYKRYRKDVKDQRIT